MVNCIALLYIVTGFSQRRFNGARLGGTLTPCRKLRQDVFSRNEGTNHSNFRKLGNNSGMSMKIKDLISAAGQEPGML
jgi:hypothetical protein